MTNLSKIFLVILGIFFCQQTTDAATTQQIIANAQARFNNLAVNGFQTYGLVETTQILSGVKTEQNYQNAPLGPDAEGDPTSGGPVVCVEDYKVVAGSYDPTQLGKDVSHDSLVRQMVEKLRESTDDKTVLYVGNRVFVVWGRKALMGKDHKFGPKDTKFLCYVSFEKPGT